MFLHDPAGDSDPVPRLILCEIRFKLWIPFPMGSVQDRRITRFHGIQVGLEQDKSVIRAVSLYWTALLQLFFGIELILIWFGLVFGFGVGF